MKEHNNQDDLFQKELLDVVVDRKQALMNAVTTNPNPATVVEGLETVVKGTGLHSLKITVDDVLSRLRNFF